MADYVAILKKTIEGLADKSAGTRGKVYEKARVTIRKKIEALDPPPSQAAVDRQMSLLERAIADVESEFELNDLTAEMEADVLGAAPVREPEEAVSAPVVPPVPSRPSAPATPSPEPEVTLAGSAQERLAANDRPASAPRRGGYGKLAAAFVVLLALAGGGYAAWLNKETVSTTVSGWIDSASALFEGGQTEQAGNSGQSATPAQPAGQDSQPATPAQPAQPAPEQPAPAQGEQGQAPSGQAEPKLTQRLMPDGTEVDEGPAGGQAAVGEGTSTAQVTQPTDTSEPAQPAGQPVPAVPVGQKAIFYEERTGAEPGTALQGAIVWSVSQESPGGDLPAEPAVQGEITIPELEMSLRMTLRRNADETLPASHIVELIFTTPPNFPGGGIDQVQRIAFKGSEQAPGTPLVALPAKIADGFFLVALNDAPAAVQNNETLMRREEWIDIPLTYKSGRRALITMEKGIPGDQVFDEVMKAWEAARGGNG